MYDDWMNVNHSWIAMLAVIECKSRVAVAVNLYHKCWDERWWAPLRPPKKPTRKIIKIIIYCSILMGMEKIIFFRAANVTQFFPFENSQRKRCIYSFEWRFMSLSKNSLWFRWTRSWIAYAACDFMFSIIQPTYMSHEGRNKYAE